MAKELKVYDELLQRIYRASDIDKVLEVLDELQYFQQSGVLSLKERFHLQVDAFRRLQQSTVDNPDVAQVVILGYLLPQCLLTNSDVSIELHGHRECLVDWLNQYPGDIQRELRRKVLENIYSHIETSDPRAACWVIERIGYRTDRIVDTLWQIVEQHNDELGDTAIRTLTSLGAPSKERARFISELHRRVAERYNHSLAFALAQLSDPTSIKVLEEHWLNLDGPVEKPIDLGIVVNVLISVLNAEVDEEDLQDNVWQWLTGLADEKPDEFYHIFYLGRVVPNCNSTLVVPKMLELLAEETEDKKNPTWGHYLIGLRLEECVRPRQLDGWSCINNPEVIELLRQDACRDTEQDLFTTSQEDMVKEMAWKTVLRAGHLNALKWFNQAVAPETGRFLQKTIIEMFAHFRFKSLPEIIKLWITDRLDNSSFEKDSRELSRRMAAVRMARSSSTREAFDVLRTFGFTFQGKPLKQSTDALAEVAHHLVGKGDVSVIDELVEVVVEGSEEHQRVAA
ncbi:MAG: hypothetical protein ISS75_06740, partial [Pirellulales bacterium]|nr:hypothetical protein [Pirellulales bacterium]